ncbi:MAG: hypothetical protein WA190_07035 [Usitatibacter sp.]
MIRFVATFLLAAACLATVAVRADESTEQVRARVVAAQKKLDDLRDNSTANDYRTIQVRGPDGRVTYRRVPTGEFAARIERAEKERDDAQAALTHPQRSLY